MTSLFISNIKSALNLYEISYNLLFASMRVVKILDHRFLKPSDTERLVPFKRESECVKFHTNPVL